MRSNKGVHDTYCRDVTDRLWEHRDDKFGPRLREVVLFREYGGKKPGEIDVYAIKYSKNKTYCLKFEIKSSDHYRRKATNQLQRSNRLFKGMDIKNFYVHYDEELDKLVYEYIKN